MEPFSEF